MQAGLVRIVIVAALALGLAGCDRDRVPQLMPDSGQTSPDEFAIVPYKPLQEPENYADLPVPTPGGTNLTDQTPNADAIAALGGRSGGVAGGDLVAYASRYGVDPNIRAELAQADIDLRRRYRGRILDRLFNRNTYLGVYSRYALNSYVELERLRRAGVVTPTAPPSALKEQQDARRRGVIDPRLPGDERPLPTLEEINDGL